MKIKLGGAVVAISLLITLTNCGGGSGSSGGGLSTEALQVAERVSVVDADETAVMAINAGLKLSSSPLKANFKAASDLEVQYPDSDYVNAIPDIWVEERSAEAFDIVNEILCSMGQTQYEEMLNQGAYVAQINITECDKNSDSTTTAGESSQNESSSSSAAEYEYWTVESSRNEGEPHIVNIWANFNAEEEFMEPAQQVMIHTEITEGVSETNPYGIFTANFKSYLADENGDPFGDIVFHGYLMSERDADGVVSLAFYCTGDFGEEVSFEEKARLYKSADGGSGHGTAYMNDSGAFGEGEKQFNMAYNGSYFHRAESGGTNEVCLDRTDYDLSAWRYGLYFDENYATEAFRGGNVELTSGFPIKYTSADAEDFYGWIDYYGVWFPHDVTLSSGETVYRSSFDSDDEVQETPYTVLVAGGKLRKNTREIVTLGELVNIPLGWNKCVETADTWICGEYRVIWNGTNLVMNGMRSEDTNWNWQNIDEEAVVFDENMWDFNFYAESLGGGGRINIYDDEGNRITPAGDTPVVFHREEILYPGDALPSRLVCFENCLNSSEINDADPFFDQTSYELTSWEESLAGLLEGADGGEGVAPAALIAGTHYIEYAFDPAAMLLEYDADGEGGEEALAIVQSDNTNREWGVWSGAMIDPDAEGFSMSDLACDWDETKTCTWKIWDEVEVFYVWETGTEDWNHLTALTDAESNIVSFDPPKMIEYTHTDGAKYYLEFNGYDLWGIPGKCVNMDTGEDTECYMEDESTPIRWVPQFSIAAGSAAIDVADPTVGYYIKPLEVEMRFKQVDDPDTCNAAGLALQDYELPDGSSYVEPDIGEEPETSGVPEVVDGTVQTSS